MDFKTACFLITFLTNICCQSLYDTNYQQLNVLNRGNSGVVFQSLLDETEDTLKETMFKMQRCFDIKEMRSVAYDSLLKMYSKGQVFFVLFCFFSYNINERTQIDQCICRIFFHYFSCLLLILIFG